MDINYIILAHKNPEQLLRLVNRLTTPNCNFYIHIDKGVNKAPFIIALSKNVNIFFSAEDHREYGTWGDIGIVKATIAILSQIVNDNRNGYCVLLSGQDYPLQNNEVINDFFATNYDTNFMDIFSLPYKNGWGIDGGLNRLNQYKINISNKRMNFIQLPSLFEKSFYKKQTIGKLKRLLKSKHFAGFSKLFLKRRSPKNIKPYGGSQWWALPIETVKEILTFINSNPKYLSFHKDTLLPDEIFFHSILMFIKEKNENVMIKPSITYVNWERKNTSLPVTFTEDDMAELKKKSENKLFARKFDNDLDSAILDLIDDELLN
ncbi:MAG: beta-1,6-N-acetylglucosaminyltransferase [Lutibacter sp.]|nr:beta-1,6-N-acetylglucosaminyltransferase [Lutibacter sp.]